MRCCIDFCVRNRSIGIQWNLLIRTPSGPAVFSFVERLSSEVIFYRVCITRVLLACPLLGGLSSFGVSFVGGFTVW